MKTVALAILLATTFAVAQENPSTHPTVYRLEYTITEMEGAKKLSSRSYSLQAEEGKSASMRVGTRVPIAVANSPEGPQFNYIDVGVNLDVTATTLEATTIRLKTNVDITSLIAPPSTAGASRQPQPTVRQTKDQLTTVIPLDKPVILTTQDDPSYTTSMQVQVIARIVK
jgi:hypothetical protein